VPHGFRAAALIGAAALAMAPAAGRAQSVAVEQGGALPGRRAATLGLFTGVVGFSRDVEIGNSYYDDQVPGLGMLIGARAAIALVEWRTTRLSAEGEARIAFARTDAGGPREAGGASVLGWRAHAVFEVMKAEAVRPFLLAGLGAETLVSGTDFMTVPDTDLVGHAGVGAEVPVGRRSALRTDLGLELMAARDGGTAAAFEAAVGYSFRFGGPGPQVGRIQIAAAAPPRPPRPEPPVPVEPPHDRPPAPVDPDGDGRAGADDQCPDQPESVNGFADGDGCPDQIPSDLAAHIGELAGVRFEPNSVRLVRTSRPALDQLAAALQRYPDVRVEIAAHTDDTGKPDHERDLSEQQAAYVKWIEEARIDAVGRGASEMKYDHSTRAGRAANWRIEVKIVGTPAAAPAQPPAAAFRGGPAPYFLPVIPRPIWLSPYARAELPLFGPLPVWLRPPR